MKWMKMDYGDGVAITKSKKLEQSEEREFSKK